MEITRERISLTVDQKDMLLSVLLSVQIGFRFVRVASACAIFERTSGFEPFFETTAPRYLKRVIVSSFSSFPLISLPHWSWTGYNSL